MNEPTKVERGGLCFTRSGLDGAIITCTLGPPGEPESETIFCVNEWYLPAMVAGLVAMQHPRKKEAEKR